MNRNTYSQVILFTTALSLFAMLLVLSGQFFPGNYFLSAGIGLPMVLYSSLHFYRTDKQRKQSEHTLSLLEQTVDEQVNERIKRLEENEQKFYKIFEMSPAGLVISDYETGTFLEINQSFADMTGYTPEELTGRTSAETGIISSDDRLRNMGLMRETGFLNNQEMRYYTKSGEQRSALISIEAIDLGDRRIFLTVIYDIAILKKAEQELIRAKFLAEESSLAKELFMANMSHEIRTPMNAIIGFTNLLEQTPLNEDQSQYLGYIRTSGENLLVLINDILDYSKIEAGMMVLESIPFNLADLLQSTQMMFSAKAAEKNIRLVLEAEDCVPNLLIGDPTRLTQILVNLVGNALKFTQDGSVQVTAQLLDRTGDKARIRLVISDTGIGIPAVKLAEIFERFTQASSETTRNFGGTGLGLSIVKSLIELQEGVITVTSTEGEGTTFTIILPYLVGEASTIARSNSELSDLQPFDKSLHILLVEDNGINQVLAQKILSRFGCRVDIAENGKIAVDMVRDHAYDLLLMDIQMPVMDGYTASKTIRYELQTGVPIIAMTANALPGEREKCISYGMTDYISKPFNVATLHGLIAHYTTS